MAVKKICILGLGQCGVPLSAVIALKCPEIRVTVVHTNPDDIFQWNTAQIPSSVYFPGLDDLLRKCQNKNLIFTTNDQTSINEADIIFIVSEPTLKTYGETANEILDLSMIEEAAILIAKNAESNKIVVENSRIPLKTAECVSKVLKYNGKPKVEFEVLSNPEFYEPGSPLRNLLFPDCILIGCESTPKGLAAARQLASIYKRWVPSKNIVMRNNWSIELSKISTYAMVAQVLSSINAMSIICEEYGANISTVTEILAKDKHFGTAVLERGFNTGYYPLVLQHLIYICESLKLSEVADYWKQTCQFFEYHRERFFQKLIYSLNENAWSKRIALLGFAYHKDTETTEGSFALYLCKLLLEEKALIRIYDPRVSEQLVVDKMKSLGCNVSGSNWNNAVEVHNNPYRAMYRCQAVVLCGTWEEFNYLDYRRIFSEMEKPAYLFDNGLDLPHSELLNIGFKVYSVGKFIKNQL